MQFINTKYAKALVFHSLVHNDACELRRIYIYSMLQYLQNQDIHKSVERSAVAAHLGPEVIAEPDQPVPLGLQLTRPGSLLEHPT